MLVLGLKSLIILLFNLMEQMSGILSSTLIVFVIDGIDITTKNILDLMGILIIMSKLLNSLLLI